MDKEPQNEMSSVEPLEKLAQLQSNLWAIGPDTRLTDVLTAIAEAANDVLAGHFCVVQPYDQNGDRFLVEQFTAGGAPGARGFKWAEPRKQGTARTALNEGMLIVEDYEKDVERYPFLVQGPGAFKGAFRDVADIRACLGLRLQAGGEKVGVLFVNYPEPHRFSEEEQRIAKLFAGQAALAIRNVRLLKEALRERAQLLSFVRETDEWIVQRGGDVEELAAFMLDRLLAIFHFEAMWLLLKEGQRLRMVATDPQHVGDRDRLLRLDASITGLAAREKRPIRIEDIETANLYLQSLYQPVSGGGMRSELAVPLLVGDRVIGVLNLESSKPGAFTADDQELLGAFARHLAVAIVSAREMQERATLAEMAIEFSGSLSEEKTARAILNRASERIGGQFGQIFILEGEELTAKWATGGEGVGVRLMVNDCASGLALLSPEDPYLRALAQGGAVILSGRSVIIPDVEKVSRYKRVIKAEEARMNSELAIPIKVDSKVVGVFNVESPVIAAFTNEKQTALVEFVRQHAGDLEDALSHRATGELKKLMQRGLDIVKEKFGQILRPDEKDEMELVVEYTTGEEPFGTRWRARKLETGQWAPITGRALMEGKAINIPDTSQDSGYLRYLGEEMKSELVVPLIVRDEAIGVINMESPVPFYFTEEHVRLLEPMASYAAAAMANARAARDRELAAVGEMSGDIVHRVNNRIGLIRARVEMFRSKKADLLNSNAYLARTMDIIESNARAAQEMVREIKERVVEPLTPFEVWTLLNPALNRVEIPQNIKVIATPDYSLPRVLASRKLEDVFYNLITNAVEAMPEEGTLEIAVGVKGPGWVDVSVRDTGRGIPQYLLTELFTPSFTTKEVAGHGLGLWWSKALVEKCGGSIEVQSEVGKGSCFTVRLQEV
jgi:GAF domain-containing protein